MSWPETKNETHAPSLTQMKTTFYRKTNTEVTKTQNVFQFLITTSNHIAYEKNIIHRIMIAA